VQHRILVCNLEGPRLFENFLISAVAAILAIRGFLHVAGYPRVGDDALHIVHMLWGGLAARQLGDGPPPAPAAAAPGARRGAPRAAAGW